MKVDMVPLTVEHRADINALFCAPHEGSWTRALRPPWLDWSLISLKMDWFQKRSGSIHEFA